MRRHLFVFAIAVVGSMAHSQLVQQGSKLVGTSAVGSPLQGCSVSLSSDGNTAIVGGWQDNSNTGAAWIFTRTGGVWSQQGSKLVGIGAVGSAGQGYSVSLSSDGNTAIVGGRNDNGTVGAAWIFTRSVGVWSQQGSKLVGSDAVGSAGMGGSVALSADGNTAIIGGSSDNSYVGAAWIFTRTGGVWSQQGSKLVGSDAVGNTAFGFSVALSADGNPAMVGGPNDNYPRGAVWAFTRTGGVWSQQGSKLIGSYTAPGAGQGNSVSLSSDGNTAIEGGPRDNSSVGAAWIFTRTGGVWSQQGSRLVSSDFVGIAYQGCSVSLSSDGNMAIIGGYGDNSYAGAAWIFTCTGGVWSQQASKLVGTGPVGSARQGYSVSLSSDGNTAIVGGESDDSYVGAAWVFYNPNPVPIELASFSANTKGHDTFVNLEWTTISEVDNYGFYVQRRGQASQLFSDLPHSFVQGHGTTNVAQHYSYTDSTVAAGVWHYRLKQVDLDGTIHYHQALEVELNASIWAEGRPEEFVLIQNYPNPFNPSTTIRYGLPAKARVVLFVYNTLGQIVSRLVDEEQEAAYHEVQFDATGLSSGVYFYKLRAGDFVATKRFLLLK